MTGTIPHDLLAEEALVGAMLLSPVAIRHAIEAGVTVADFYRPAHAHVFDAVVGLHAEGSGTDVVAVADRLRRSGLLDDAGGSAALVGIQARCPSTSAAGRYARIVMDMAALRRVIGFAGQTIGEARSLPDDVDAFLETIGERFTPHRHLREVPEYWSASDFAARQDEARRDWIIEPFLERGERMLIVAGVGTGKSVVMRQMAMAAAAGVNPFLLTEMKPIRTLIVDLENPDGVVIRSIARLDRMARRSPLFDPDRAAVWHVPTGIDVRIPSGFDQFDAVLADHAPDVVAVGPLYKLFRKRQGESDEDAALDVLARLDDLRGRHRFVLVLEHHAPHGQELRPFGSSVWQRWPEFGPALMVPSEAKTGDRSRLVWGEWRGPREPRPWPRLIMHGSADQWPWLSVWDDGKRPDSGPKQDGLEF